MLAIGIKMMNNNNKAGDTRTTVASMIRGMERGAEIITTTALQETALVCLDLQVDENIHNRVTPTVDDKDRCLIYYPPTRFVELVSNFVVGAPNQGSCDVHFPPYVVGTDKADGNCGSYKAYDETQRKFGNDWPPFGYTMIGKTRIENFRYVQNESHTCSIE